MLAGTKMNSIFGRAGDGRGDIYGRSTVADIGNGASAGAGG